MRPDEEHKNKILSFVESSPSTFTEIRKALNVDSNQLSYHLKSLLNDGLLKKADRKYSLTQQGKTLMPYQRYATEFELLPMVSVGVFIRKRGKILLLKREWEPFKGYYLGVSGKLKRHEDIYEAARKRVKELVSVDIKDLKLFCINNFVSKTHHFVMFFFSAATADTPTRGVWVDTKDPGLNIFPETEYLLNEVYGTKGIVYLNSFSDDRTGEFRVLSRK